LSDASAPEFYVPSFRTPCPIFIGRANMKNNWKEIVRVFIQVKVYLKRSLGQLERGGMGRGVSV